MPGLRENDRNIDNNAEFIEDILLDEYADDPDEVEQPKRSKKSRRSTGEYLRKIEMLMEQKRLKENLSDYDWDDI